MECGEDTRGRPVRWALGQRVAPVHSARCCPRAAHLRLPSPPSLLERPYVPLVVSFGPVLCCWQLSDENILSWCRVTSFIRGGLQVCVTGDSEAPLGLSGEKVSQLMLSPRTKRGNLFPCTCFLFLSYTCPVQVTLLGFPNSFNLLLSSITAFDLCQHSAFLLL